MKKCLGIGCIFSANGLKYTGDFVVNIDDGTVFLTNCVGADSKLVPWIELDSFEKYENRFMMLNGNIKDVLFDKFKVDNNIKEKVKNRYYNA